MMQSGGLQGSKAVLMQALVILLAVVHALLWPMRAISAESVTVFHVGVTAFRDKAVTVREWQPTMDYLSSRLPGTRFVTHPMNLPEFERALAKRELHFVITNPEHYILMEARYGVSRLATLVKNEDGKLLNQFGGVIFTRSDRPDIHTLQDVKGKTIASADRSAFAAFLLQYDLLKTNGVDIDRDSRMLFLGFPQDLAVTAVLEGRADVGFVRTGVLEAMAHEGKIPLFRIRVLNSSVHSGFPHLLSTGLFPEWPFAAAPNVPVDIANQVAAALLLMPPDGPAPKSARYYRWSTPVEYQSVQSLMRRHRIYPFDTPEKVTPQDILRHYGGYIFLITFALALAMAVLYLRARRLNIALRRSRRQLNELAHHDALTGLPNRNLLDRDLDRAIASAKRTGASLALCMIDLDGFKPINDKWGHRVGDLVLKEVAERLQKVLRVGDTVARWGGDEFVLLLTGITTRAYVDEIITRVLSAIAQPLACCKSNAQVRASIGICMHAGEDDTAEEEILRRADEAMYFAKKSGGNQFIFWPPTGASSDVSMPHGDATMKQAEHS